MAQRITIIGAGVAGLTAAIELSAAGAGVEIVERAPSIEHAGCSWFAGGMLAPWCERVDTDPDVAAMGCQAPAWWAAHAPDTVCAGSLVVAQPRDRTELERFAARTQAFERVDAQAIGVLEPDLAGRFTHGLFFADEAHVDPRRVLPALLQLLEQRDVPVRFGVDAKALAPTSRTVLDCRGYNARDELDDLRGVRGEMLLVECHDLQFARPVRLLHPRGAMYVIPRGQGRFMIGGSVIESADTGPVTVRSAMQLLNGAYALHPAFAEAHILELGVGIRPAFADNLPHLLHRHGRWYLNGLFRHGFLLSPAMAQRTANTLLHRQTSP